MKIGDQLLNDNCVQYGGHIRYDIANHAANADVASTQNIVICLLSEADMVPDMIDQLIGV